MVWANVLLVTLCVENGWPFRRWTEFAEIDRWLDGVLDACTTGGSGIIVFWPLSCERFFLPWQVIAVSPIVSSSDISIGL